MRPWQHGEVSLTAPVHVGAPLRVGAVFPQTEIGADPAALRLWTRAVEAAGFDFACVFDHVLGANPERPGGWSGPYTHQTQFHEVMVLLGWMAALTERLELVTEILVLPQRQTALVAKQAAEIAVLSEGRLRLGVGLGWNRVELEGLGMRFADRARRVEEQIEVLRRLWAEPLVTFHGTWHQLDDVGINPLPPGGTIPLWMGANADVALRRVARLADGWMTNRQPGPELDRQLKLLRHGVRETGREPLAFGVAGRVPWRGDAGAALDSLRDWARLGATHVSISTMGAGLTSVEEHVVALQVTMNAWQERVEAR